SSTFDDILFISSAPRTVTHSLSLHDALPISALMRPWWSAAPPPCPARSKRRLTTVATRHVAWRVRPAMRPVSPCSPKPRLRAPRSEEHTSELQSRFDLVCRLLLE